MKTPNPKNPRHRRTTETILRRAAEPRVVFLPETLDPLPAHPALSPVRRRLRWMF